MVLRLSCVWELFDVAPTWNAPRSFPGATKATCFNFYFFPPAPLDPLYLEMANEVCRTNGSCSKKREKPQSLRKPGGGPDVSFRALIFTWFSGGKLSQTRRSRVRKKPPPRVGAAYSKSVPTVANRLFKRGSFQVLSPGERTSKHIQTLRWRSFAFFFFFFPQKVSASPGTGKTKNLTRSRQEQRRCFSSSAVRASGTRLDGSWKILGCAFHHEGARERCRRRSSGEAAGRVMASRPSPSLSSIIPADFTPSQKRKQTVSLCRAMSAAATLR